MNTIYNMYKRGLCFMFIDHCGNVGIRPANTNFLLHAIFYGTHDDESGVSSLREAMSPFRY